MLHHPVRNLDSGKSAGGKAFQCGKTLHNRHLFRRSEPWKSGNLKSFHAQTGQLKDDACHAMVQFLFEVITSEVAADSVAQSTPLMAPQLVFLENGHVARVQRPRGASNGHVALSTAPWLRST